MLKAGGRDGEGGRKALGNREEGVLKLGGNDEEGSEKDRKT